MNKNTAKLLNRLESDIKSVRNERKNTYELKAEVFKATDINEKRGKVRTYLREKEYELEEENDKTAETVGRWWFNELKDDYETHFDLVEIKVSVKNTKTGKTFSFSKKFNNI